MIPEQKRFVERLYDMIHPAPVEKRTAEEITQYVIQKTGITLIED